MNFSFFLCLAACRMRSSACDTVPPTLCPVRALLPRIPLGLRPRLHRLAPPCSSASQLLWRSLTPPRLCIIGYGSSPSRCGLAAGNAPLVGRGVSRVPRTEHACMPGSSTTPGRPSACAGALGHIGLPLHRQRRHLESVFYRGSMVGLHVPLPTLRRNPHGCLRTAPGPMWFAIPSSQWTCTHLLLAGLPAHLRKNTTRYNRTQNFGLYGHAERKKAKLSSARHYD